MNRNLLVLSLALCLLFAAPKVDAAECYVSLGIGYDRSIDEGRNPQSVIRAACTVAETVFQKGDSVSVEYDHHSSIRNGFPFNDKEEDLADQMSVVYTVRLRWQ